MNALLPAPPLVRLTLDGRPVAVPEGTSLREAARRPGIDIPALCHSPRLRPVGVCRRCVVDLGPLTLLLPARLGTREPA